MTIQRELYYLALPLMGVFALAVPVTAQISQKQADGVIQGMQGAVCKPALKKVLKADSAALGKYMSDSDPTLARYALEEAARRKDLSLIPALDARLTSHVSEPLSAEAGRALSTVGGETAHRVLLAGVKDSRPSVSAECAVGLANMRDRAAIPGLHTALNQHNERLQLAAADYLAGFDDRASIPRLLELTRDPGVLERRLLCGALGRFGGEACQRRLREMARTESYAGTRSRAALSLGTPGNRSAVPCLINALTDPSPDVRWAAAQSLECIGDRRAIPYLQRANGQTSPDAPNTPKMEAASHVAELLAIDEIKKDGPHPAPIVLEWRWEKTHPEVRTLALDYRRTMRR